MIHVTNTSKVKYCSCSDKNSDSSYGKGFRVHQLIPGKLWRCTVCGSRKVEK